MQLLTDTHIDFIRKRKLAYIISAAAIVIGIISLVVHGGPKYGIDFTGGISLQVKFEKNLSSGDIRNSLAKINLEDAEIKSIGMSKNNEYIIRTPQMEGMTNIAKTIQDHLRSDLDGNYEVRAVTEIGPKIGGELRRAAIMAIFISLIGLLIYISWRFEFKFAVGAIAALFHDVMITLGIFSIMDLDISLAVVAAFLTIVGYSLNDTIVVYDRIRENIKILRRDALISIMNKSINQTLARTIITSFTTLMVVIILFLFGGEVIYEFSIALIIGVLIGTYSSIFVASPIVYEWQSKLEEQKKGKPLLRSKR